MDLIAQFWTQFRQAVHAAYDAAKIASWLRLTPVIPLLPITRLDEDRLELEGTPAFLRFRAVSQIWRDFPLGGGHGAWGSFLDSLRAILNARGIPYPDDPVKLSSAAAFALLADVGDPDPTVDLLNRLVECANDILGLGGVPHGWAWGTQASRAAELVLAMFAGWQPPMFVDGFQFYSNQQARYVLWYCMIDHLLYLVVRVRSLLYADPFFLFFPRFLGPGGPVIHAYPPPSGQRDLFEQFIPYWAQQLVENFLNAPPPLPAFVGHGGNAVEQLIHQIDTHYLLSWDPEKLELWKFLRRAVCGTFNAQIQPGGISSGMAYPLLHSDCGLKWTNSRATFLCPRSHCGNSAERQPISNWADSTTCTFCSLGLTHPPTVPGRGLITEPFFQAVPCVRCSASCCDCGNHVHFFDRDLPTCPRPSCGREPRRGRPRTLYFYVWNAGWPVGNVAPDLLLPGNNGEGDQTDILEDDHPEEAEPT